MASKPLAALLLLLAAHSACSAPVIEEEQQQTTQLAEYEGADTGCYYNFQHYAEGDRIATNEPCLNCTCHRRMLMCYLRVCPFTRAIGQDCSVEKRADQCCPVVTCPEVPVHLVTSTTTTAQPAGSTAVALPDSYGCSIDGEFYGDGAQVAGDPSKPCELCYCIRNRTACVMQQCTLQVEGCQPVFRPGVCCPVRYDCDYSDELLISGPTERPSGLILTTTPGPVGCNHNGDLYADGARIAGTTPCEHCYCMRGDMVCAVQDCTPPLSGCTALPTRPGSCCPEAYQCPNGTVSLEFLSQLGSYSSTQASAIVGEDSYTAVTSKPNQDETEAPGEVTIVETATKGVKVEENAEFEPISVTDAAVPTETNPAESVYGTEEAPVHADGGIEHEEESEDSSLTQAEPVTEAQEPSQESATTVSDKTEQDLSQHLTDEETITYKPEGDEQHDATTVRPEEPQQELLSTHEAELEYAQATTSSQEQEYQPVTTQRPEEEHYHVTYDDLDVQQVHEVTAFTEKTQTELATAVTESLPQNENVATETQEHITTYEPSHDEQLTHVTEEVPPGVDHNLLQNVPQTTDSPPQDTENNSTPAKEDENGQMHDGESDSATTEVITEAAPIYTDPDSGSQDEQQDITTESQQKEHETDTVAHDEEQAFTESHIHVSHPEEYATTPQQTILTESLEEGAQIHEESTEKEPVNSEPVLLESDVTERPEQSMSTVSSGQYIDEISAITAQHEVGVTNVEAQPHEVSTYSPGEQSVEASQTVSPDDEAKPADLLVFPTENSEESSTANQPESLEVTTEVGTELPMKSEAAISTSPEAMDTSVPKQPAPMTESETSKPSDPKVDQLNEIGNNQTPMEHESHDESPEHDHHEVDKISEDDDETPPTLATEITDEINKPLIEDSSPEKRPEENFVIEYPAEHAAQFIGSCVVDGMIFTNGSGIPPANPCQTACHCRSGMVQCRLANCAPPPPQHTRCMPVHHEGVCCPTYACDSEFGSSPESDSQIGTEEPPSVTDDGSAAETLEGTQPVTELPAQHDNQDNVAGTTEESYEPELTTPSDKYPVPYGEDTPVPVPVPEKPLDVEILQDTTIPVQTVTEASTLSGEISLSADEKTTVQDVVEKETSSPFEVNTTPGREQENIPTNEESQPVQVEITTNQNEMLPVESEGPPTAPQEQISTISEDEDLPAATTEPTPHQDGDDSGDDDELTSPTTKMPDDVLIGNYGSANQQTDELVQQELQVSETEKPAEVLSDTSSTVVQQETDSSEDDIKSTTSTIQSNTELPETTKPAEALGEVNVYQDDTTTEINMYHDHVTTLPPYNKNPEDSTPMIEVSYSSKSPEQHSDFNNAATEEGGSFAAQNQSAEETTPYYEEQTHHITTIIQEMPIILEETTVVPQYPSYVSEEKVQDEPAGDITTENANFETPTPSYENPTIDQGTANVQHLQDELPASTENVAPVREELAQTSEAQVEPETNTPPIVMDYSPVEGTASELTTHAPETSEVLNSEPQTYETEAPQANTEVQDQTTVSNAVYNVEQTESSSAYEQSAPDEHTNVSQEETTSDSASVHLNQSDVEHVYIEDISPETESPESPQTVEYQTTVPTNILLESDNVQQSSSPDSQISDVTSPSPSGIFNAETETTTLHEEHQEQTDESKEPDGTATITPTLSPQSSLEDNILVSSTMPLENKPHIEQDESVHTEAPLHVSSEESILVPDTTKGPEQEITWAASYETTPGPIINEPAKVEGITTQLIQDTAPLEVTQQPIVPQQILSESSNPESQTTQPIKPIEEEESPAAITTLPPSHIDADQPEENEKPNDVETPDDVVDEHSDVNSFVDSNHHSSISPETAHVTPPSSPTRPPLQTPPNKLPPGFMGTPDDFSQFAGTSGMAGQENFPPGSGTYLPPGDDYDEEDDQAAYGRGTCRYAGKVYVSAQQIPRDDPCDFCFCFRSDIICLQQSCPPPIPACHEEPILGFCCPRYECPVSMATALNITTTTTTTTTTLPPHFLHHAYRGAAHRTGCQVRGQAYRVGDTIRSASGPCLHCTCGADGQMQCEPKVCSPEPMLRKMIAAAAAAKRRR